MYLLPSSCHPPHITKNIPYSLCVRLVRICSDRKTLLVRMEELRNLLLSRNYLPSVINSAFDRALLLTRENCLKKVVQKPNNRVVFTTTYHPALPSFSSILTKAWKVMVKDNHMKEVFDKPLVAYRQARKSSLRSLLVKTKLPQVKRANRTRAGMKKCNKCNCCPFIQEGHKIQGTASNVVVNLSKPVSCQTENIVYCLSCTKPTCSGIQYIGETGRKFQQRLSEHLGYIRSKTLSQPTGLHFNLPGHSASDMKGTIIEHCGDKSKTYRKLRESFFINQFNTVRKGMNKKI